MRELIARIRESREMTQAEFARVLGISQGMLSMLESGKREAGGRTIKALVTVATPQQRIAILNALQDDKMGHDGSEE